MRNSSAAVNTIKNTLTVQITAFALTLLLASAVFGQSGNVDVRGNARIASSTILSVIAEELQGSTSPARVNDALQALNQTGFFKTVEVSRSGGGLVFTVVENPAINRVAVEGNKRLKDEVLLPLILSQSRQTYSPRRAEADAIALAEAYAASGRLATKITPKIIERSQNRVDLVFQIVEGRVSEVQKISVSGNRAFSERRLRGVLQSKQIGVFRAVVSRDTFLAERLEADKQVLRDFYLRNGYVDFEILSATADLTQARDGFLVNIKVREGQQYRFGDITVVSAESDINPDAFLDVLKAIKTGRVYRPAKVETVAEELDARAAQYNKNFVSATPRINRNDATRTLDIEFELARGQRVFVERIDIEGNATTLDRVIRREFQLAEGDAFNRREIQLATDRIRALGYFENVSVEAREGSTPSRAVIDVNVTETTTGSLNFGLSYSSGTGVGGNLSIEQRNFLGRGQTLRAGVTASSENTDLNIGFVEPRFLDRDLAVGFDLAGQTTTSSFLPIETRSVSFSPHVSFPTSEFGRLGASYRIASSTLTLNQVDDGTGTGTLTNVPASAVTQAEVARGPLLSSTFGLTYTLDKRNSVIEPTAGYRFSVGSAFTGIGGDKKFLKTEVDYSTFRSFADDQIVLSLEVEGGSINNLGNASQSATVTDRFFLGGDQLRGFQNFGIGPRDTAATAASDPVGGNLYAVARFEASFPIGIPEEYGIFGGVFFDVGTVWGLDNVPGGTALNNEDTAPKIRSAIGLSIFWDTAIGPLRFNFSRPIQSEVYDRPEDFRFTIDTRF